MAKVPETAVVNSALWAAYGDAIGFPTELVSKSEFSKRNGVSEVSKPIAWKRRVSGLFGPEVPFPAGTYSDDTQLRLSTSRAIRGNGFFDVESFAKVELPVWLNYALGGGRGSKAAAANLALRETSWAQNFFATSNTKYCDGGGNGAAMRIQPHVWLHHAGPAHAFVADVLRNSVCTHGHPRGILGALIHAALLSETLKHERAPAPDDWAGIGESVAAIGWETLLADTELSLLWMPTWERVSKSELRAVWEKTSHEWIEAANEVAKTCRTQSSDASITYARLLADQNAFDPSERGSGLKTALYASVLAWLYRQDSPEAALAAAANAFGSDTDTIGTMAGALLGVVAKSAPGVEVQDARYIAEEASRLYFAGADESQPSFQYPDLLSWVAPRSQSDAWVLTPSGENRLSGIGRLKPQGKPFLSKKGSDMVWQWAELEFGQTVLAKRRPEPAKQETPPAQRGGGEQTGANVAMHAAPRSDAKAQQQLPLETEPVVREPSESSSLDVITHICIRSNFDPAVVGAALLEVSRGPMAIERAIAFASIIAKAKVARAGR